MDPSRNPILIASRDPLLKNYLKAFLAHWGYPIFCSEREDETRVRIGELAPALVVLDLTLSDIQWVELEKTIQELKPRPAFLLLTDPKSVESKRVFGEGDGLDHVRRPFDLGELKEKVQRLLAKVSGVPTTEEALEQWGEVPAEAGKPTPYPILGISKKLKAILAIVDRVAETDVTVLIRGESGTGKELVARRIHDCSGRRDKPFIKVLCPAIPDNLLESELFGYEKGSFTGAFRRKPGRFEFANEGTIFLDEIGEIPFSLQSKLLQVLQEGEFARIGGKADIRVNVRIISATNRDLEKAVREGSFREDLFYRLNVVNIYMPSLRDRKEDIPLLVRFFLDRFNRQLNKKVKLSNDTLELFMEYRWPGNVREIENTLEGMVILGNEKEIVRELQDKISRQGSLPMAPVQGKAANSLSSTSPLSSHDRRKSSQRRNIHDRRQRTAPPLDDHRKSERRGNHAFASSTGVTAVDPTSLKTLSREAARKAEQELIRKVLDQTHWNRKQTAKILGISYKALLYKIKHLRTPVDS